jgi:hypothetical protein
MTERDPRMLPGVTAKTASNIAGIAGISFFGLFLLALLGLIVLSAFSVHVAHVVSSAGTSLGIVFIIASTLVAIFGNIERSKERRELDAGYTTFLNEFDQVDGISSRTGEVGRPAVRGQSVFHKPGSFSTGVEIGSIPAARTPLQIVIRSASGDLWMMAFLTLLGGGVFWFALTAERSDGPAVGSVLISLVGLIGVGTVLGLAFGNLPAQYYRRRLIDYFPGSRVFSGTPDNSDLVAELTPIDSPRLSGAHIRYTGLVVFRSDEIVLLSRHRLELLPFLAIPRSRVVTAALTSRTYGKQSIPAVNVTVTKDNGTDLTFLLELAPPGTKARVKLTEQCQWIIDWASAKA